LHHGWWVKFIDRKEAEAGKLGGEWHVCTRRRCRIEEVSNGPLVATLWDVQNLIGWGGHHWDPPTRGKERGRVKGAFGWDEVINGGMWVWKGCLQGVQTGFEETWGKALSGRKKKSKVVLVNKKDSRWAYVLKRRMKVHQPKNPADIEQ